jgi:phosphoribosyl 1,2-cyclic phosphodiesterase
MKIVTIASGSGGNATLFESAGTRILVDAGVGPRTLAKRLEAAGASGALDALVVTHAHGDHIGHCSALARASGIPAFVSESTARVARLSDVAQIRVFGARQPFSIGGLTISPTPLPHDAAQVAFVVSDGARSAAIVTDLGEIPPGLLPHIAGCDVLLIESNYDDEMLARGPYLPHLKRRVASARGHLSNMQTHGLLRALPERTHTVVLMHISHTNNRPDLALEAARDALAWRKVRLVAASQDEPLVVDAAARPPAEMIRSRRAKPQQLSLFPASS